MKKVKEKIKNIIKEKKEKIEKRRRDLERNKKSIIKILTMGSLLIGLPIIILGYYIGRGSIDILKNKLGREGLEIIELRIKKNLRSIEIINEINRIVLEKNTIINIEENILNDKNYEGLLWLFRNQVKDLEELHYIYIGTQRGNFFGIKKIEDGSLRAIKGNNLQIPSMRSFKIDENGIIEESEEVLQNLYDPRMRTWYITAMLDNEIRWSEIYKFASEDKLGITSIIPISINNKIEAVLGIDFNLILIENYISDINITKNAIIFIIDKEGNIIANSNNQEENRREINIYKEQSIIRDIYLYQKNDNEKREIFTVIKNNERYKVYTRKILNKGFNWKIFIVIPDSDFSNQNSMLINSLRIGVIGVIIIISSLIIIIFIK